MTNSEKSLPVFDQPAAAGGILNRKNHPPMTGWFGPFLLCKLLLRVIVGGLFGQYADRRLIMAALDFARIEEHLARARISGIMKKDQDGAIWLDYVSDLGDGFDGTYAVAYCLARDELGVDGRTLPRGSIVVMGGDQVYPTASRDEYNKRLRQPYELAYPRSSSGPQPHAYLIPGNHDWYDGLVSFLALFCREKATSIGHWKTHQRRTYFALEIADGWWIWSIDIALTEDMDQPQADYFVSIAKAMPNDANIILCSAEPGWYVGDTKEAAYRSLDYAAWLANNAKRSDDPTKSKNLRIVVALSGDTHHYARYETATGMQFVTSGGGGAFLHGTQSLKDRITLDWLKDTHSNLELKSCYPSKEESHELLGGNLNFARSNKGFSAVLGIIYWLFASWLAARPQLDTGILTFLLLSAGFCGYAGHQSSSGWKKPVAFAVAHATAHWVLIVLLASLASLFNAALFGPGPVGWTFLFAMLIEVLPIGSYLAGTLFGLNLRLTARNFDLNHNDAFSSMRLDSYRHLLRLRIKGDELTIFPIGMDRVPSRTQWRHADGVPQSQKDSVASQYHPPEDWKLRLIEPPIVIRGSSVPPVASAVNPAELKTATPGEPVPSGDSR